MVVASGSARQCACDEGLKGLVSEQLFLHLPARNVNCPQIVQMASSGESTPSPTKQKRAEIDTSKPYADVREAILRFDQHPGHKSSPEKRAHESPIVGTLKEQLAEAVAAKAKVESDKSEIEEELVKLRADLEQVSGKLEQTLAAPSTQEDGDQADADLNKLQSLYEKVMGDLEESKNKIQKLEMEREVALKQAENAAASLKNIEDAVKELEISNKGREEEATLAKASEMEAKQEVERLSKELSEAKQREDDNAGELNVLKGQILSLEGRVAELVAELSKANEELGSLRSSEAKALASLGETLEEMKRVELKLKETEDEKITLQATTRYLEPELESTKAELNALKDEAAAEDAVEKYKTKVEAVKGSEMKSREAVAGVMDGLEQVSAEVIEAEAVKEAVEEEIRKMKAETKELRASAEVAEKKMDEMMVEAQAAKAAEAEALEGIKKHGSAEDDGDEQMKKLHQVEEETNKKIMETNSEVEAIRTREEELKRSLEKARAEIEASKLSVKQANEKAASAEAAKSAVEGELRRKRSENEQRRRTAQALAFAAGSGGSGAVGSPMRNVVNGNSIAGSQSQQQQPTKVISVSSSQDMGIPGETDTRTSSAGTRLSGANHGESLAQVLQIKLPDKEIQTKPQLLQQQQQQLLQQQMIVESKGKKKKLKLLARLGAVFSSRKKSSY